MALALAVVFSSPLLSCSGSAGPEVGGATIPQASDAETPAQWLEVARNNLRQPRQATYESTASRGSKQSGRLVFQDITHFRVESTVSIVSTTPSGESQQVDLQVASAADGETLRIQMPAVFGAPASMAIFPVQRFDELAAVAPHSPLHRYRPESLNPIAMAQTLLDDCTAVQARSEDSADGMRSFTAELDSDKLIALGIVDASEREAVFHLQFELAEASGKFVGLRVVDASSEIARLLLHFNDLPSATAVNNKVFSLTIPEGQVIVDLSLQLTR